MDERARFTGFWIRASATNRCGLERVPEGATYRPDTRSRSEQEIAWQNVGEDQRISDALEAGRFAWTPEPMPEVLPAAEAAA